MKKKPKFRVLDIFPGKRIFGIYRFLPIFFVLGGLVEFSMINWQVGEISFYRVFMKKQAEKDMPAGVSLPRYVCFMAAAMLSMFAGSQVVHNYYKPMKDFETFVETEKHKLKLDTVANVSQSSTPKTS